MRLATRGKAGALCLADVEDGVSSAEVEAPMGLEMSIMPAAATPLMGRRGATEVADDAEAVECAEALTLPVMLLPVPVALP